jgi:hypothetical protein
MLSDLLWNFPEPVSIPAKFLKYKDLLAMKVGTYMWLNHPYEKDWFLYVVSDVLNKQEKKFKHTKKINIHSLVAITPWLQWEWSKHKFRPTDFNIVFRSDKGGDRTLTVTKMFVADNEQVQSILTTYRKKK